MSRLVRPLLALVVLCCGVSVRAEEYASAEEMAALRGQLAAMQQRLDQSLVTQGGDAGCGCDACCEPCDCCQPCQCGGCCPGWNVSAEYLHWKLYSDNLHFVWLDANNLPVFGDAQLTDVNMDYDSGYRFRAAYQTACCWEVAGVFTHYDTANSTTVVDPDGQGGARLRDTRLPVNGPSYERATGSYDFDLDTIDLEFAKLLRVDCCAAVRLFGGVRYADIDQHLSARYDRFGGGTDTFDEIVNSQLFGVRAGSEGWWCFCSGLGLYGRLAGSVLVGTVHHDYVGDVVGGIDSEVGPFHEWFGAIPVLEVAAGVSYCRGNWEIAAGWEANAWFGLSKSMRPVDDVDETRFSNEQFDLILAGWTFRASYGY